MIRWICRFGGILLEPDVVWYMGSTPNNATSLSLSNTL